MSLAPMLAGLRVLVCVVVVASSCAANPARVQVAATSQLVFAPGESRRIANTGTTVTFEQVVEDSRCPTGVTCAFAGDASVRIGIQVQGQSPSKYVLHTNVESQRQADHPAVRVTLVNVVPYPSGDTRPRPDEYRVTLLIEPRPR